MLHFLISGIATPFITCIPTEVSEHWFKGRERTVVTAIVGMGDCFGLILGNNNILSIFININILISYIDFWYDLCHQTYRTINEMLLSRSRLNSVICTLS